MEGRFISKDPIGFEGGLNLYSFVSNNATSKTDATGLSEQDVWIIHNKYREIVDRMTREGSRNINPYINNLNHSINAISYGTFGDRYLVCWGQTETVTNYLRGYANSLDDNWTFELKYRTFPLHWWGEANSDSPCDPKIIYDPWKDTFTIINK